MINRFGFLFFAILLAALFFFAACNSDEPLDDPSARLEFSLDTLTFDTVFTSLGSATRRFKVYNRNTRPVIISKIWLEGTAGTTFRMNVDGIVGREVRDLEIPAEDSIYVFAEVTVNPSDLNSPFIISDVVHFETNGNAQQVVLEAWGQNAIYLGSKGTIGVLRDPSGSLTLNDPKPYVIYGVLIVDSTELILPAGCRIYVHGGVTNRSDPYTDGVIFFTETAKLTVNGTLENPVIIRGDRLEPTFDDDPGQWAGILLSSRGNVINHAVIRNSVVGVRVDSAAELTIKNSTIHNTQSSNLLGIRATIYAENCLFFSSNGGNNVQLEYGGDYRFNYCTMASFSSAAQISHGSPVLRMTNVRCFDEFCTEFDEFPLAAAFKNCIIYGSRTDEVQLFDRTQSGNFNFSFENCLIKSDQSEPLNAPVFNNCTNCIVNQDPKFVDITEYNYQLDTLSPAENRAAPAFDRNGTLIARDKLQQLRDATTPDIGAFEYQY